MAPSTMQRPIEEALIAANKFRAGNAFPRQALPQLRDLEGGVQLPDQNHAARRQRSSSQAQRFSRFILGEPVQDVREMNQVELLSALASASSAELLTNSSCAAGLRCGAPVHTGGILPAPSASISQRKRFNRGAPSRKASSVCRRKCSANGSAAFWVACGPKSRCRRLISKIRSNAGRSSASRACALRRVCR